MATSPISMLPIPNIERAARALAAKHQEEESRNLITQIPEEVRFELYNLFRNRLNAIIPIIADERISKILDIEHCSASTILLHLCIFASASRLFSGNRTEINALKSTHGESILHRRAKAFVESVVFDQDDLTYCQALVILADIEYGCGRMQSAHSIIDRAESLIESSQKLDSGNLLIPDAELFERRILMRAIKVIRHWYNLPPRTLAPSSTVPRKSPQTTAHERILRSPMTHLELASLHEQIATHLNMHPNIAGVESSLQTMQVWCRASQRRKQEDPQTMSPTSLIVVQQYLCDYITLCDLHEYFRSQGQNTTDPSSSTSEIAKTSWSCAIALVQCLRAYKQHNSYREAPVVVARQTILGGGALITTFERNTNAEECASILQTIDEILEEMKPSYTQARIFSNAFRALIKKHAILSKACESFHWSEESSDELEFAVENIQENSNQLADHLSTVPDELNFRYFDSSAWPFDNLYGSIIDGTGSRMLENLSSPRFRSNESASHHDIEMEGGPSMQFPPTMQGNSEPVEDWRQALGSLKAVVTPRMNEAIEGLLGHTFNLS